MSKLSKRIKELREVNDISQKKLADILGLSQSTIGMYETDKREPNAETLAKLAEIFGVTVDFLLGKEKTIKDLEEEFPEAIQLIRKANSELSDEGKEMLIRMMKALINNN